MLSLVDDGCAAWAPSLVGVIGGRNDGAVVVSSQRNDIATQSWHTWNTWEGAWNTWQGVQPRRVDDAAAGSQWHGGGDAAAPRTQGWHTWDNWGGGWNTWQGSQPRGANNSAVGSQWHGGGDTTAPTAQSWYNYENWGGSWNTWQVFQPGWDEDTAVGSQQHGDDNVAVVTVGSQEHGQGVSASGGNAAATIIIHPNTIEEGKQFYDALCIKYNNAVDVPNASDSEETDNEDEDADYAVGLEHIFEELHASLVLMKAQKRTERQCERQRERTRQKIAEFSAKRVTHLIEFWRERRSQFVALQVIKGNYRHRISKLGVEKPDEECTAVMLDCKWIAEAQQLGPGHDLSRPYWANKALVFVTPLHATLIQSLIARHNIRLESKHVLVSVVLRDIIVTALSAQPPGPGRERFQVRRSGAISEETWYYAK